MYVRSLFPNYVARRDGAKPWLLDCRDVYGWRGSLDSAGAVAVGQSIDGVLQHPVGAPVLREAAVRFIVLLVPGLQS